MDIHLDHNIRPTTELDIESVFNIESVSQITPWTKLQITEELHRQGAINYSLFLKEELIAYIFSYILFEELHILNIAVKPDQSSKGFGTSLLDYILSLRINNTGIKSKETYFNKVFLECRKSNTKALNLYSKFGFIKIDTRKSYYDITPTSELSEKEDALILFKEYK